MFEKFGTGVMVDKCKLKLTWELDKDTKEIRSILLTDNDLHIKNIKLLATALRMLMLEMDLSIKDELK